MSNEETLKSIQKEWHGSFKTYALGLVFCLLLTGASFSLVAFRLLTGSSLWISLVLLAIFQAAVQLVFFLHVGQEEKPRWESLLFYFMLLVLAIIVLGSLWIMFDLDNRTMLNMTMDMSS